jgi:hypothetical protein
MLEELLITYIGPSWMYMIATTFMIWGIYQVIKYFLKEFKELDRRSDEADKRMRETSYRFLDEE